MDIIPQIIVPPVGKPWQQYQPPLPPPLPTRQMESIIAPPGDFGSGETSSKRKKPSILRRKSNNAKKAKTEEEEEDGGAAQQQQQQPLRCPMCPAAVMDLAGLEQHLG